MVTVASTLFETPYGQFDLQRYPRRRQEPLQAWCAADRLILEACHERQLDPKATLVVNDDHGALSSALEPQALWTDSALSATAVSNNLERNYRQAIAVRWSTGSPGSGLSAAVLRIPKQYPYFEYQLAQLAGAMAPGGQLICAGMDKHLSPHTATLIEKYFGPTARHRGQSKARLFSATRSEQPPPPVPQPASYFCDALGIPLIAQANVFSRDALDIGSRFLLEHLHELEPVESLADLACGNGVLGLVASRLGLCQQLTCCDESAMAIASTRHNARQALGEEAHVRFHHGDGLLNLSESFDMILCNPPFHLGHTVDDYAGRRLLGQCAGKLKPNGALCLVANRHLDYGDTLKRHFKQVQRLAQNRKFSVWLARRG